MFLSINSRQMGLVFLLAASVLSTSCQFAVTSVDDFTEVMQAQETQVHSVLDIGENGDVVAEGIVMGLAVGCESGDDKCHFLIVVDGVTISVFYLLDPDRDDCVNTTASEQAQGIGNGNRVRVFGKYFGSGRISICGNPDYFVENLTADN